LIFGNDNNHFQTQSAATFIAQPITTYNAAKRSNVSNIEFGTGTNNYTSENNQNFAHKEAVYLGVEK
jgi:hypothetical protein